MCYLISLRTSEMKNWFERAKSKNFITALLVALLQILGVRLKNHYIPIAWFDIILLLILTFLSWKKIITSLIPIGFISVVIFLCVDPGGLGLQFLVPGILIPMFIIIKKTSTRLILFLYGLWIGSLITIGISGWLWDGLINLLDYSPLILLPVFIIIGLVLGLQFPIFFLLTRLFYEKTGFPLGILGAIIYTLINFWMPFPFYIDVAMSLVWVPILIQIADIVGMAGITLSIALTNGILFTLFEKWQKKEQKIFLVWLIILLIILGFQISYGLFCLQKYKPSPSDTPLNVAMIQSMSPLKIMNADHKTKSQVAENLLRLSRKALSEAPQKPDILIWPEGAASFSYKTPEFNSEFTDAIKKLLQEIPITLLVQDTEFVKIPRTSNIGYYNHISLIGPDGDYLDGYRKNLLLPFAEYLPGERMFPFLRKFFSQTRSVLKGKEKKLIDGPGGAFVPSICFEIVSENFVREFVKQNIDASYLVNLTNDRWYGAKQQPQQHLSFAVFRAVENRLPVIRCTNSGISAIIDAVGIIRPEYRTNVMKETTLNGTIYPRSRKTFYCKFGDILPKFILTPLFILGLIYVYILGQKKKTL